MLDEGIHVFYARLLHGFKTMKKPIGGRRRTNKVRNNQLDEIHVLSCRGFTQSQIASKLGLSQSQICRDLETINQLISPQNATERAKRRDRMLAELRHAKQELWEAWDLSKKDKETSMKEKVVRKRAQQGVDQERGPAP